MFIDVKLKTPKGKVVDGMIGFNARALALS